MCGCERTRRLWDAPTLGCRTSERESWSEVSVDCPGVPDPRTGDLPNSWAARFAFSKSCKLVGMASSRGDENFRKRQVLEHLPHRVFRHLPLAFQPGEGHGLIAKPIDLEGNAARDRADQ